MKYKVVKILDLDGNNKLNKQSKNRLNKIGYINIYNTVSNNKYLFFLFDKKNKINKYKGFVTSKINSILDTDNYKIVRTCNTEYHFMRVNDEAEI